MLEVVPRWWSYALAAFLSAAACSGGGRSGQLGSSGANGTGRAGEVAEGGLTEADCARFVDHTIAVALAEARAALPPERALTDEQVAKIRSDQEAMVGDRCIGQPRVPFDCAMKAETAQAVELCLGVEES
jgi:hypothetical protein